MYKLALETSNILFGPKSNLFLVTIHYREIPILLCSRGLNSIFFLSNLWWVPRPRLVHVYAGSKIATGRRMDHALCIIHHVIGFLSDSTPCWRYRVPRHGAAWHGLVKHKHWETINKRNVARIPCHVLLSCWNSTERKCPRSLPITFFLPLAFNRFSFSSWLQLGSVLSPGLRG